MLFAVHILPRYLISLADADFSSSSEDTTETFLTGLQSKMGHAQRKRIRKEFLKGGGFGH